MSFDGAERESVTAPAPRLPKKPAVFTTSSQSNLPIKPAISLLPPQSSLTKYPNLARPPSFLPSPLAGRKGRVVGQGLSLPNSPIQAKLRHEEEDRRKEQAARHAGEAARMKKIQAIRDAWLRKLEKSRAIVASVDQSLSSIARHLSELERRLQAWRQKLNQAEKIAELVESFNWADTASVDHYLWRSSLVERGKELQVRWHEEYKEMGLYEQGQIITQSVRYDLKADLRLDWIEQRLEDTRPGRHRGISLRETKLRQSPRLPKEEKLRPLPRTWLLRYADLCQELLNNSASMAELMHILRQNRRVRSQVLLLPEVFEYHKFTFPLEHVAFTAQRAATELHVHWLQLRTLARSCYHPSDPRLRKILGHDLIDYHIAHLRRLTKRIFDIVRHNLAEVSNSILERELFSAYRWLTTYTASFRFFLNEMHEFVHDNYREFVFSNGARGIRPRLKAVREDVKVLEIGYRHILREFEFVWLWNGISRLFYSKGQYASEYNASTESAPADPPTPSIVHTILPPGRHNAVAGALWQTATPMYPLGLAIPILYIMTHDELLRILPRFNDPRRIKHLSFDTVRTTLAQGRCPFDFLILATEHEVAIIHLGIMDYNKIVRDEPFRGLFGELNILKVGIDVEPQQRILRDELGVDVEGLVELHMAENGTVLIPNRSFNDQHVQKISSMAARTLGYPLPALDLGHRHTQRTKLVAHRRRIAHAESPTDPVQYFEHLALRAYAVLHIYLATISTDSLMPAQSPRPLLGPVQVLGYSNDEARIKYVKSMARSLAAKTIFRSKFQSQAGLENHLIAYFLFTTFNESLETIGFSVLPKLAVETAAGKVAGDILAVVRDSELPLRREHELLLERTCRWHGQEPPPPPPETGAILRATSPGASRRSGLENGAVGMASSHTTRRTMDPTAANRMRARSARVGMQGKPCSFADLFSASDLEEQQKELALLAQRIKRAKGRQQRGRKKEATLGEPPPVIAIGSTPTEQALTSKIPSQRLLVEGTGKEHKSTQPRGTNAPALTNSVNGSRPSLLRDRLAPIYAEIGTITGQKGLTRLERMTKLKTLQRRKAKLKKELVREEVTTREMRKDAAQAGATAEALEAVLDVDNLSTERESVVKDTAHGVNEVGAEEIEEDLAAPSQARNGRGDKHWWDGEL